MIVMNNQKLFDQNNPKYGGERKQKSRVLYEALKKFL